MTAGCTLSHPLVRPEPTPQVGPPSAGSAVDRQRHGVCVSVARRRDGRFDGHRQTDRRRHRQGVRAKGRCHTAPYREQASREGGSGGRGGGGERGIIDVPFRQQRNSQRSAETQSARHGQRSLGVHSPCLSLGLRVSRRLDTHTLHAPWRASLRTPPLARTARHGRTHSSGRLYTAAASTTHFLLSPSAQTPGFCATLPFPVVASLCPAVALDLACAIS